MVGLVGVDMTSGHKVSTLAFVYTEILVKQWYSYVCNFVSSGAQCDGKGFFKMEVGDCIFGSPRRKISSGERT